jgi:uncharacterized membrane protein YbhN (UPF0104 family)
MAVAQRRRISGILLVCIALALFGVALFSYAHDGRNDWWSYSLWARRWIMFTGVVLAGIACRILFSRDKTESRKHGSDATRKT